MTVDRQCRIGDFGNSKNIAYDEIRTSTLYTNLVPPECLDYEQFLPKSDVYVRIPICFQLSQNSNIFILVLWMDFD